MAIKEVKGEPIEGFPGYRVDREGNVYSSWEKYIERKDADGLILSTKARVGGKQKVLKATYDKDGYAFYCLRRRGRNHKRLEHRLVAGAFVANPFNHKLVCHKDDNPRNNHADNLYWGTVKMNSADMVKRRRSLKGEKAKGAVLNNEKVRLFRLLRSFFGWEVTRIAKTFSLNRATISGCINKSWQHIS